MPQNLESVDSSAALISRIGGESVRDVEFRQHLYYWIGAAVVAGGKVEAAMKGAILQPRGATEGDFASVDENWTTLEKELRALAVTYAGNGDKHIAIGWGEGVLEALEWGVEHDAKKARDNIVHAYWWDFADTNATRGRFFRKGRSVTLVNSLAEVQEQAETIMLHAQNIESLTGPRWLNYMLPRENPEWQEPPRQWARLDLNEAKTIEGV